MIEGIHERDWKKFRLVRLILDSGVQAPTTWQLEEGLIMLTSAFIEKKEPLLTG